MFSQSSLAAVVRNLRSAPGGTEEEAMDKYIADTKIEVNNADPRVKVAAIQKATYFHMLGYSSQYANFRVVEMMASPVFLYKRIAYLAACLTFTEDTDVIPLMTASLKRDLSSGNAFEVGLALYCVASICTSDMAQDVVADVVNLLSHPRSYVRKKATLSLYRIFLSYPESLRLTYGKLKEKLEDNNERTDTDPAVRGAVVCVLCELARRNPANFLGLAVPFYSLLSSVHSNWTLIKVVKVFGYFAPLEPRLGKKLVEPISNLINTTSAKSVQYECLLAVANGMSRVSSLTALTTDKVRTFVEDSDPNLKFLGLEALSLLAASADNRKLLADQREVVLRCLDDLDSTIRLKALRVLQDLTTRRTVVSHINHMLDRCVRTPPDEAWSNAVIRAIIETAQTNDYEWIQDFEWYLGVLLDLCVVELTTYAHGAFMEQELVCILSRVNAVRRAGVEDLAPLLRDVRLLSCDRVHSTQWRILCAAAFVCGEYPHWVPDIMDTCRCLLDESMTLLPADVQLACVVAVGKMAAYVHRPCARHTELCNGEEDCRGAEEAAPTPPSLEELVKYVLLPEDSEVDGSGSGSGQADQQRCGAAAAATPAHRGLLRFCHSTFPGVLERAHLVHYQLVTRPDIGASLSEAELQPVAAGAQDAIEVPDGVDLDAAFCDDVTALMDLSGSDDDGGDDMTGGAADAGDLDFNREYRIEQQRRTEQARREEMSAYYLRDAAEASAFGMEDVMAAATPSSLSRSAKHIGRGDSAFAGETSSSQPSHTRARRPQKVHNINRVLSKPANYAEKKAATARRSHTPEEDEATRKLRGVDVTRALRADERLPETLSYAQLLRQQRGGTAGLSLSHADQLAAAQVAELAAVTLYDKRPLRVYLTVSSCKVRRDGFHLGCVAECVNATSSSAVSDLQLAVAVSDGFPEGGVRVRLADSGRAEDGEVGASKAEEDGAAAVCLAEKLKGAATARVALTLQIADLPPSFTNAPVLLTLSWMAERKRHETVASFALEYLYFTKPLLPAAVPTPSAFLETVVGGALATTPIASAFLPCSKTAIMTGVAACVTHLRLAAVDVFKDAMSLYGLLHGRKSELAWTHVAVLLQEQEVDGAKGMAVTVRCHYPALGEALILKMAEIVAAH